MPDEHTPQSSEEAKRDQEEYEDREVRLEGGVEEGVARNVVGGGIGPDREERIRADILASGGTLREARRAAAQGGDFANEPVGDRGPESLGDLAPSTTTTDPSGWKYRMVERVMNDFKYHTPTGMNQVARYTEIRRLARTLALTMIELTPVSCRELASALTRLEEAVMHANAGIARHTPE